MHTTFWQYSNWSRDLTQPYALTSWWTCRLLNSAPRTLPDGFWRMLCCWIPPRLKLYCSELDRGCGPQTGVMEYWPLVLLCLSPTHWSCSEWPLARHCLSTDMFLTWSGHATTSTSGPYDTFGNGWPPRLPGSLRAESSVPDWITATAFSTECQTRTLTSCRQSRTTSLAWWAVYRGPPTSWSCAALCTGCRWGSGLVSRWQSWRTGFRRLVLRCTCHRCCSHTCLSESSDPRTSAYSNSHVSGLALSRGPSAQLHRLSGTAFHDTCRTAGRWRGSRLGWNPGSMTRYNHDRFRAIAAPPIRRTTLSALQIWLIDTIEKNELN